MGTIIDERICKPQLRIIVCHYYLRRSLSTTRKCNGDQIFLNMFEFADSSSKDFYRYIHNAMCEYVCFCLSRFFVAGRNEIRQTSPQM